MKVSFIVCHYVKEIANDEKVTRFTEISTRKDLYVYQRKTLHIIRNLAIQSI